MNVLREHLAAFELRRGARRSEDAQAARGEEIDDSAIERQLGPDDGEIDAFALGEREQARRGRRRRRRRFARSARCRDCRGRRRTSRDGSGSRRELPGERMLAPAAADHQHLHDGYVSTTLRSAGWRTDQGRIGAADRQIDAGRALLPRIRDYL